MSGLFGKLLERRRDGREAACVDSHLGLVGLGRRKMEVEIPLWLGIFSFVLF